jgi:hypothetical protein
VLGEQFPVNMLKATRMEREQATKDCV